MEIGIQIGLLLLALLIGFAESRSLPEQGNSLYPSFRYDKSKWKTYRPLIGILSQGGDPAPKGHTYIAASYVKYVESAGARAVPILPDMTHSEVCSPI